MQRPRSVTVIAWIWIVLGALTFFPGVLLLAALLVMDVPLVSPPGPALPKSFPLAFLILHWLGRWTPIVLILWTAGGCVALVSGIYFLKLRTWARTSLEVLSWLGLLYLGYLTLYNLLEWIIVAFPGGPRPMPVVRDMRAVIGGIAGIVIFVVASATLLILMIKFLRGETIRNALSGKTRSSDARA